MSRHDFIFAIFFIQSLVRMICTVLYSAIALSMVESFFQGANQNRVYNVRTGSLKRNSSYIRLSARILTRN